MPSDRGPRPGDIIIESDASGLYVITKADGERIGTSADRREAMRRACAAIRDSGARVWMHVKGNPGTYHEVLCP